MVPRKDSLQARKRQGAEFFAVAYGVQIPYIGQDDSIDISSGSLPPIVSWSQTNPTIPSQHKGRKRQQQKTRLLGDILDPFYAETMHNLNHKLTPTCLCLPAVLAKRNERQSKKCLKEMSKNFNFTNDVVALHCSHTSNYNEDELSKAVYQSWTRNKSKVVGDMGHDDTRGPPLKPRASHVRGALSKPVPTPDALHKIDQAIKQEMEDILFSVAQTSRPYSHSIVKIDKTKTPEPAQSKAEWDEYVLSLLSKSTASWLAREFSSGAQHSRLASFLKNWYRGEEKDKENEETEKEEEEDTTKRSSKTPEELENVLTESIFDGPYSPSFSLPSTVGDKKLVTDNAFQQEMLAGAFPIKGKGISPKTIILNTNSMLAFEKRLQENYPIDPSKWSEGGKSSRAGNVPGSGKVVKGLQRWNELPSLSQDDAYIPPFKSFHDKRTKSTPEVELLSIHQARQNDNVLQISEEWRNKWLLEKHWQNATTKELIRAMNDIHDHVRLAAVAAGCKAAEMRRRKRAGQNFGPPTHKETFNADNMKNELEPELIDCVVKLLDDHCKQVSITAAVTLCTLNISESKAVDILQETVQNGNAIERWIAAQCLASAGRCTDDVIGELVSQTCSRDPARQKQAGRLLLELSHQSSLVHAIVAEQLNSSSSEDRLLACRLLPGLRGTLNKDIAQKLTHMMWNDWNKDVRTAAAQALGRTGNGKLVHDALLKRLQDDNERIKVDALRKLADLGVMTTCLLPAFLSCFTNEFVSVRIEAAVAAAVINTPHEDIIASLVRLANEDESWKVKAHAIKALGAIRVITDDIVDMLVWSMRYSNLAAVRAEACKAVAQLGLKDSRILSVLQDRVMVETEEVVRSEARTALKSLNVEFTGDVEMINVIRAEVKRLCNKSNVVSSILERDKEETYEKDYQRMIAVDESTESRCTQTPQTGRSLKSSASSRRGWDPILAGFRARSVMSQPSTPMTLNMERSRLPLDLNSASSEGSMGSNDDLESENSDSVRSDPPDEKTKTDLNERYLVFEPTNETKVNASDLLES